MQIADAYKGKLNQAYCQYSLQNRELVRFIKYGSYVKEFRKISISGFFINVAVMAFGKDVPRRL